MAIPIHNSEDEELEIFLDKLFADRKLDFRSYNRNYLKRRIAMRMCTNKVRTYSQYLGVLINNPREYEDLFDALTINVSEFFRDSETFRVVRNLLLPELIRYKRKENRRIIRIWSAGCAGGEEAFSVAILLREMLEAKINDFFINIYGTDIDKGSLERARRAEYPRSSLKEVNEYLLTKYFTPLEKVHPVRNKFLTGQADKVSGEKKQSSLTGFTPVDERFKVKDEVREMVKFQYHNLISDSALKKVDVILCRNVVIYFDKDLQQRLFMKFYNALNRGGFFVMGRVETLSEEAKNLFKTVDLTERIYRKL